MRDWIKVGRGEYEEYEALAVFEDKSDAQAYCDWWNLNNLNEAARMGRAEIASDRMPVYGRGEWHPPKGGRGR